jgi:hypothetical protein
MQQNQPADMLVLSGLDQLEAYRLFGFQGQIGDQQHADQY